MADTTPLTKNDLAALTLAMEQTMRDPMRKEQLEAKLQDESWFEVATFASYHRQMDTLNLDPAEGPPCWIGDPDVALADPHDCAWCYGNHEAARLLKKMHALGISKYHPDPLVVLKVNKGGGAAHPITIAEIKSWSDEAAEMATLISTVPLAEYDLSKFEKGWPQFALKKWPGREKLK